MEETISLKELLETLKKRILLIISITLVAALTSGVISYFFLTPIYQASTLILVNQERTEQSIYSPTEVQTNLQLINTYNIIMKSPPILDKVIDELDLNMTTDQLNGKITVGSEKDSQVVNVSVTDPDAQQAADIANKTAEVFQEEIVKIMKIDNVSILAKATIGEDPSPIKPKPLLNVAIAIVVGLMTAVGLSFLLEYFDNTIKNEQDVEKILELPILGVIPTIDEVQMEEMMAQRKARKAQVGGESLGA
ncbi:MULTISPECIES: YveK family protein [unclassified Bacillus (in: firmicutes)]|uniref:YveK family protein n=1 Tax=unclassified Bacillus (in: firmicutes) TaxID=185979 RepID=UPI0008EF349C|nr:MULTISPECIES: Wzz/FepE/Etk N-terminal domain-containing protein [unclassified Bacillus (in: firmicutes)]SFB04606.1 Capsular polysaccharide biosynthesis protein [Bacillus sp. UNCCL13]SFQ88471.1 Capsular polysaccharide biosynthesis protein [Bacillus sp. cl95]